jgi:hypothetical protein
MQPNDLLAPFVQLLQCLKSCVFFVHLPNMEAFNRNSRLHWAESIKARVIPLAPFFNIPQMGDGRHKQTEIKSTENFKQEDLHPNLAASIGAFNFQFSRIILNFEHP